MLPDESRLGFDKLVNLFEQTQTELQRQAARSVDRALVVRNWLFGWYIVEYENAGVERSELYGKKLLDRLADKLKKTGIRGASPTNLRLFRKFYLSYEKIQQTVSAKSSLPQIGQVDVEQMVSADFAGKFTLGWSHYVVLLTLDDAGERSFYEIEAGRSNWSVREMKRQIGSSLYERLALSRDKEQIKALSEKGQLVESADDIIKDPYVLEFLNLSEKPGYSEHELETAIIDKLEHFLLELGRGFLFEARQKRFTFDDDHFFVDLVFYNRLLRCYVLIDLKRDKLTHQDLGQMQMYVNYFDRYVKIDDEAPTVGIVLCHRKHDALVELTLPSDSNIYAAKYQLYLPSKEELRQHIMASLKEQEGA